MRRFILTLVLVAAASSFDVVAQEGKTLRVYLARHGQTDGNLKGIAQGWTDTPLNETGLQHAATLAERLRGVQLDGIYSSTLSRSRTTAETVASGRKVKVTSLRDCAKSGWGSGRTLRSTIRSSRRGRLPTSAVRRMGSPGSRWPSAFATP